MGQGEMGEVMGLAPPQPGLPGAWGPTGFWGVCVCVCVSGCVCVCVLALAFGL